MGGDLRILGFAVVPCIGNAGIAACRRIEEMGSVAQPIARCIPKAKGKRRRS
jgi:hypothetical protein